MLEFVHPDWFWALLILIPIILYELFVKQKRKVRILHSRIELLRKVAGRSSILRFVPILLRCVAIIFLVIALARPRLAHKKQQITGKGIDIILAIDVSGSMNWEPISKNSSVFPYDIGIMLGSMAHQFCTTSITGMFGDTWKTVPMSQRSGILSNTMEMRRREGEVGYSTNGYKVIEYLLDNNIKVERIMMFTDCQMWDSHDDRNFAPTFIKYQRMYPDVKLYLFDLSGYGNIVIPPDTKNICLVAGWSDRVFDFIQMFEGTGTSAIEKIRAITP